MSQRLFHSKQQEKITPTGLQYILCKHDFDKSQNQLVFFGVELIFDSKENSTKFRDQFNNLNDRELLVSPSAYKNIGHLKNENMTFCEVTIRMNSVAHRLEYENPHLVIRGELICKELYKKVNLADVAVLNYAFHHNEFISIKDMNAQGDDYSDAPDYLKCPISQNLMKDPITLSTGITYDRWSLTNWCIRHCKLNEPLCPKTNQKFEPYEFSFKTNVLINGLINEYKEQKKVVKINDSKEECTDQLDVDNIAKPKF